MATEKTICFVTGNPKKLKTLRGFFDDLCVKEGEVIQLNLNIVKPQAMSVRAGLSNKSNRHSEYAWSDFWYVFYLPKLKKALSDCSAQELFSLRHSENEKSGLRLFAEWYATHSA